MNQQHGPDAVRRELEGLDDDGWRRYQVRLAMVGCAECAAVVALEARRSRLRAAISGARWGGRG